MYLIIFFLFRLHLFLFIREECIFLVDFLLCKAKAFFQHPGVHTKKSLLSSSSRLILLRTFFFVTLLQLLTPGRILLINFCPLHFFFVVRDEKKTHTVFHTSLFFICSSNLYPHFFFPSSLLFFFLRTPTPKVFLSLPFF